MVGGWAAVLQDSVYTLNQKPLVIFCQKLDYMGLGPRHANRGRLITTPTHSFGECLLYSPAALGSTGFEVLVWEGY